MTRGGGHRRAPIRRGFLTLEAAGALALVMVMLVFFAYSTAQLRRAQQDSTLRRALRLAAENELSRIRAGLEPLPPVGQSCERVRGAITVTVTAEPGAGDWEGLVLVRVMAVADGRDARATQLQGQDARATQLQGRDARATPDGRAAPDVRSRFELAGYVPAGASP